MGCQVAAGLAPWATCPARAWIRWCPWRRGRPAGSAGSRRTGPAGPAVEGRGGCIQWKFEVCLKSCQSGFDPIGQLILHATPTGTVSIPRWLVKVLSRLYFQVLFWNIANLEWLGDNKIVYLYEDNWKPRWSVTKTMTNTNGFLRGERISDCTNC